MDADRSSTNTTATSPKGAAVFAKRVQRQLSRAQEKVLQRLGKTDETKDEEFDYYVQDLNDQQNDGSRIYKDLKAYLNAVKGMREASKRLSHSLFDAYESEWSGLEDLGAIVEGEDLLWNDYETKILDQALRTMEAYMSQFPDVKEKVAKRNRKLVDYDSSRHHLEALQNAKKKDEVKVTKATEEMQTAKYVYEDLNKELKDELPVLYGSRVGCYVTVFQAVSTLRDVLYKELGTMNHDFQDVLIDLKAQHPDKVFTINTLNRSASLKRRSLISPRSWKASFNELQSNISPRGSLRRRNPSSPLRSVPRPSLEGTSPNPAPLPSADPLGDSIAEVRDDEVSSTSSEPPQVTEVNGVSGTSQEVENEEKEKKALVKEDQDKQDELEFSTESTVAQDAATEEVQVVQVDNTPVEAKEADWPQTDEPCDFDRQENGEASNSQSVGTSNVSSQAKGAEAEVSSPDRETEM